MNVISKHKPTLEKDPCRYFQTLLTEESKDIKHKLILSLAFAHLDKLETTPKSIEVKLDRSYGPETDLDEANLRKIFGLLQELIISPCLGAMLGGLELGC